MTSTVFTEGVPAIAADWLNDVNNHVYGSGSNVDPLTQIKTGGFFQYDQYTVVKINRLNDRVFIGDATANDASPSMTNQDWLTQFQVDTGRSTGFIEFAQAAVLTNSDTASCNGLVVGGRTSTLGGVGNTVPILAVGVNNNTAYGTGAYAFYGEAYNMAGALGPAFGMELDTVNYQGIASIHPYAQHNKQVVGLQLAAGAELSSTGQYASSAAINIRDNNSVFEKGIVFGAGAISTGVAVALASGHKFQWYGSGGVATSQIICSGTAAGAANAVSLNFTDQGLRVEMPNGYQVANFSSWVAAPANYIQFVPGATGNPVQMTAQGSDANINLYLAGKGGGKVQFGTHAVGPLSPTGYITILDQAGTPRRLLVG